VKIPEELCHVRPQWKWIVQCGGFPVDPRFPDVYWRPSDSLEPDATMTTSRTDSTEQVIIYVRDLIARGELRPGDRLPAERDLAIELRVSRPTIRAGLRALAAMGVIVSRHGSGTYIPAGPPILGSEPLRFLAALHGFSREEMYEVRRVLEVSAAGLAAERASAEHTAAIAEEVASLFASIDDPQAFLVHDIRFHQAVAAASGNPILGALVEMVSALYYERRRETAMLATDRNLRDAADLHRSIYQAIRTHDADRARAIMNEHLLHSAAYQAEEEQPASLPAAPVKEARKRRTRTASTA
jgi:GntR family transcriptional regulator, transcriptional repressor for pyruvate dehydrogenase complex